MSETLPTLYVYVAGPLSGLPGEYLANAYRISRVCRSLIDLHVRICPINPAGDAIEGLTSSTPLSDADYKDRSMDLLRLLAFLPKGHAALYVLATKHRNGSISAGVADEITNAMFLDIPIVYTTPELLAVRAVTP
jgi:hypothetical protein